MTNRSDITSASIQNPMDHETIICCACGTQYKDQNRQGLVECRICEDPRQFVPPSGQAWTNLVALKASHKNVWTTIFEDEVENVRLSSIMTSPKFAIGQRAFLLQTPKGNILWDLIALLDDETITAIQDLGGVDIIVISHPHYYTTYSDWATTFRCPVYFSPEDKEWINFADIQNVNRRWVNQTHQSIAPDVTAIKCGGHFPGSLVLHWNVRGGILFLADSIVTVPSAYNPFPRHSSQITYTLMWSIPNMIPMSPDDIRKVWDSIRPFRYCATYGAFEGMDIRIGSVKLNDGNVIEETDLRERMLVSIERVLRGQLGEMNGRKLLSQEVLE